MVVCQMPHEEAHNATNYKTSKKLTEAQEMERDSWIMRRRGLRATVERLQHGGQWLFLELRDGGVDESSA